MKSSLRLTCFGTSTKVSAFLCLGILLLSAGGAWGQTSSAGTVAGLVTDEQNAAIPTTVVKLTDMSTNVVQSTITNNEGRYVFGQVQPGKYNLSFGKEGFTSYRVDSQQVDIGQSLTLNATLKVGSTEIGRVSCRERV